MKIPKITKASFRIPSRNELLAKSHKSFHTAYFAAVFVEGHGFYAATGGVLFLLAIVDFFLHYDAV